MTPHNCTIVVLLGLSFFGVGQTSGLDDDARLSAAECKSHYDLTRSAQSAFQSPLAFGFIDNVPILAPVRTVAPDTQAYAALTLFVYMRHTGEVSLSYLQAVDRIRKETPEAARLTRGSWEQAINKVYELEVGVPRVPGDAVPHEHNGIQDHDHSQWAGIKSIVPAIESLAEKAGYVDVQHECTPGIAMCLHLQDALGNAQIKDAVARTLKDRHVLAEVHVGVELDWRSVTAAIERNIPLVCYGDSNKTYLVVGYSENPNAERVLFGFDPQEVERGVYVGGQQMIESRFQNLKRTDPNPSRFTPLYYDLMSAHKQHQIPGFCCMPYNPLLRFSYIANARADHESIKRITKHAFESAISESMGEEK